MVSPYEYRKLRRRNENGGQHLSPSNSSDGDTDWHANLEGVVNEQPFKFCSVQDGIETWACIACIAFCFPFFLIDCERPIVTQLPVIVRLIRSTAVKPNLASE
jgi:hypothetical protein